MNTVPIEMLPIVDPMMVRRFYFRGLEFPARGGCACVKTVTVEDVEIASTRLDYDEDIVDCSYAVLELTNGLILTNDTTQRQWPGLTMRVAYFNGRRWRNHRIGRDLSWPEDYLLYIGNPIRIDATPEGIVVHRSPEFRIRSGMALQAEMELK